MRHWACGVTILTGVILGAFAAWTGPAAAQVPGVPVVPILGDPMGGAAATFEGTGATPAPVGGMAQPPRNPFLAPNGRSNIHDDAYMTDTYAVSGPLGDGPARTTHTARVRPL